MSYADVPAQRLEIDDVPLSCAAWRTLNLDAVWQFAPQRGSDRLIPGAAGVRAKRRRTTVALRTLELAVWGDVDWEGTATADPWEGLEVNLQHLHDNVVAPTGTGDGTRDAVLYMPSGGTRSGSVHVVRFEFQGQGGGAFVLATMDLSIPAGHLEWDGS